MRLRTILICLCAACALQAAADSRRDSLRYDRMFFEGVAERQRGNHDSAFQLFRLCTQLNPEAAEAHYYLGQCYEALREREEAVSCLETAARLEPYNPLFQEELGSAYVGAQRYDDAIAAYERLLKANSDRLDILQYLVQLYKRQDNYPKVLATIERIEALDGVSEATNVDKVQTYIQLGRQADAIAEADAMVSRYPNDLSYRSLQVSVLQQCGRTAEAKTRCMEILDEAPRRTDALMQLAGICEAEADTAALRQCIIRLIDSDEATPEMRGAILQDAFHRNEQAGRDSLTMISLFDTLVSGKTFHPEVAMLYVSYMDHLKMPADKRAPLLERVLAAEPDNVAARFQLIQLLWSEEHADKVIELATEARQYNPEEMVFYYFDGIARYQKDDLAGALDALQRGVSVITPKSSPELASDFYAAMGDICHSLGRRSQAYEAYDSCLQWKPDNISCLNNFAYYLSLDGRQLDKAERMSRKAITAEPNNATYLDTYAWILFMQKRYEEAKIYIDQALDKDTAASWAVLDHAGDIYYMVGNTDRAVQLWQQAAKQPGADKLIATKIKRRKYLRK